ncbi:carbohydrate kinase family protein [Patescibacteria group bacterium]|nr:carbohydrate kinase family protein [Patescibacteria group bacterium]MBU4162155.1 carbohydrate kinase family protein [Patescibacteria group bacterium]
MQKYDVITFGSASEDIFVFSKEFFDRKFCFPLGDKMDVENLIIRTGGGGTNTAATFALQGLKVAFCGSVGKDYAGFSVLLDLKKRKISTEFLNSLNNKTTNHSVILSKKEKGKVILAYRDASNYIPKNFNFDKLKAHWFYLAPLAGECAKKTKQIIDFAHKNKIKVAINPSREQIEMYKKSFKALLPKIDILLTNEKETKMLFGNRKTEDIFREIKPFLKGLFVTGGENGLMAFDGKFVYKGDVFKSKISDLTGAGDAFGSGLVAWLIKKKNMIEAIQFGSANTVACVKEWGAKDGLLKKGQKYQKIKIKKYEL